MQKALEKMKFKHSGDNPNLNSCTSVAMANLLNRGKVITPATKSINDGKIELKHIELYMKKVAKENGEVLPIGEWYGIRTIILKKIYHSLGFKFTSAIIDGVRFPQKCILYIRNPDTPGESHVACRLNGILYDVGDWRQTQGREKSYIAGFYTFRMK